MVPILVTRRALVPDAELCRSRVVDQISAERQFRGHTNSRCPRSSDNSARCRYYAGRTSCRRPERQFGVTANRLVSALIVTEESRVGPSG